MSFFFLNSLNKYLQGELSFKKFSGMFEFFKLFISYFNTKVNTYIKLSSI